MKPKTTLKTRKQNPEGLHLRYYVAKRSGEPVDPRAEYFVLRLDPYGKDHRHINACRKAVLMYATEIESSLPKLAADIYKRYNQTVQPPHERLLTHRKTKKRTT